MGLLRPAMPLTIGSRLGSYEIVAPIGAGGMGEGKQSTVTSHQSSGIGCGIDCGLRRPTEG
jgi:hypothetical protein